MACIEDLLNTINHDVACTTPVLMWCLISQWYIAKMPPNFAKRRWSMHANTRSLCNTKVKDGFVPREEEEEEEMANMTHMLQCTKVWKRNFSSDNVEYKFCFCHDNIKHCVNGNKKYKLDWHVVPNAWPMNTSTKLSREEVLALEDDAFSPRQRLSTIVSFPIPWLYFRVPLNSYAHPTSGFSKIIHWKPTTPTSNHKNKWESTRLMDGYYLVGVTPISCHGSRVVIYIVSKANIAYHVTIGNIPYCTCLNFTYPLRL